MLVLCDMQLYMYIHIHCLLLHLYTCIYMLYRLILAIDAAQSQMLWTCLIAPINFGLDLLGSRPSM